MKTKCKQCGYEWESKSKLFFVTCPSCLRKVELKKREVSDYSHVINQSEHNQNRLEEKEA